MRKHVAQMAALAGAWVSRSRLAVKRLLGGNWKKDGKGLLTEMPRKGLKQNMKTELNRINRAFRKEVKHWIGYPNGFANKKQWKNWCRQNAVALAENRRMEGVADWEAINDQLDADSAVIEEMSNW